MIKAQTLKGFRDFLPASAIKRQFVVEKIKEVFERFGFDPLETPALEYAETLLGKYGDEADKLLYLFEDRGGRNVGMRYDQTVPASRVVSQYSQTLPNPFKRYQIQPVWRAENTQKGRYREFLQCDADIFGDSGFVADAEIIAVVYAVLADLGFAKYSILVNDRTLFGSTPLAAITIIDKLKKIGAEGVRAELTAKNLDPTLLDRIKSAKPTDRLDQVLRNATQLGVPKNRMVFDPTLARGLDYYTSTIFEVIIDGYEAGSVGGGGRYDDLIKQFSGRDVPAVGFAFGFDRVIEAMEQSGLLPSASTATTVLVTVFSPTQVSNALTMTTKLRQRGVNAEVALSPDKLDKQLKYADTKGIPYAVIQGPDEVNRGVVKLKYLPQQKQEEMTFEEVINKMTS